MNNVLSPFYKTQSLCGLIEILAVMLLHSQNETDYNENNE